MSSELDEEVDHLAEISSIAMGIEESESCKWVFPKRSDDFVAGLGGNLVNLHAFFRGDTGERELSGLLVLTYAVRSRCWWEESELRRHV